jgi:serine/threonine-protein kinase 11
MAVPLGTETGSPFLPDDAGHRRTIKKLSHYTLLDVIGFGASSKVYLALDTDLGAPVAAKYLTLTARGRVDNIEREVQVLRKFTHPNLVGLREVLHSRRKNCVYIVLDWAPYGPLSALRGRSLPESTIASIFRQVCEGLSYLHDQGVVHQDIKPANILLFPGGVAKITDFGISHSFESASSVIGSPGYQPPEVFSDAVDAAADPVKEEVWSLGVSIYEVAFGRLPFTGNNLYEVGHDIATSDLAIPQTASETLTDLLLKMLNRDPESRLTLDDVKKHPFFDLAKENFELPIEPQEVPDIGTREVRKISAEVCDNDYIFDRPPTRRTWWGIYGVNKQQSLSTRTEDHRSLSTRSLTW